MNILSWSVGDSCSWERLWCWKRFHWIGVRGEKICETSQKSNRRPRRTYSHCYRCHSHESAWVFTRMFCSRDRVYGLPSLLQHRKLGGCATSIMDQRSPSYMQKRFKCHLPQRSTKITYFYLGKKSQIWVGGVMWSQTLINHCVYGIFHQNIRLNVHFCRSFSVNSR